MVVARNKKWKCKFHHKNFKNKVPLLFTCSCKNLTTILMLCSHMGTLAAKRWNNYVTCICKGASRKLNGLFRVWLFFSYQKKKLYRTHSSFDNCITAILVGCLVLLGLIDKSTDCMKSHWDCINKLYIKLCRGFELTRILFM